MKIAATYQLLRPESLICGVIAAFSSLAAAAEPWGDVRPRPQDFLGTLSCTSASCHGGAETWGPTGLVTHQEYVRWLGTEAKYIDGRRSYDPRARLESINADPHAMAAWRMSQPRFQEVLRKASLKADGSTDAAMYQRCAACHDPLGIATSAQVAAKAARQESTIQFTSLKTQHAKDQAPGRHAERGHAPDEIEAWDGPITMVGISCESCHGGGKHWISAHYQRDVSRQWLAEHGMIDTKNLFVRARQCASCHIGSTDQDMNHDMIAAGHPPLRFEHASYEALLVGKHWNDAPARGNNPNYEVQLWAAGRIAAAEAALALLEGRARRAEDANSPTRGPWPEFAESNCFACHQPLRSLEGQKAAPAASNRPVGVAQWQTWNLALANLVSAKTAGQNELPPANLSEALAQLRSAMEQSFEPPPAKIASLAAAARATLRAAARIDASGQVLDQQGNPLDVDAVLRADAPSWSSANWDEACQRVAVLAAANRSLKDGNRVQSSASNWMTRLGRVSQSLRFSRPDREWPAVFEANSPGNISTVASELDMLRRDLLSIGNRTNTTQETTR